jgi:hypothetical protein
VARKRGKLGLFEVYSRQNQALGSTSVWLVTVVIMTRPRRE